MNTQELLSFCNKKLIYNPLTGSISKNGFIRTKPDTKGYLIIKLKGKSYKQHRIAFLMTYKYLPSQVEHKNRIRNDNRILNLRPCNNSQNQQNTGVRSNNSSGYKGVHWRKNRSKWITRITINSKRKILGSFSCKHQAAICYNEAALKYFKEFAYLNTITYPL